jgi:hypothetical protein
MNLECSVCLNDFNEGNTCPRILACGHSFCSSCLEKMKTKDNAITCPTCRKDQLVADVAALPKNFALLDAIAGKEKVNVEEQDVICMLCVDEHPATHRCLQCEENMCAIGSTFHTKSKTSRNHTVIPLDEVSKSRSNISVICAEHGDPFKFYDTICQRIICVSCFALDHQSHKCISIPDAAKNGRSQLTALAKKAKTGIAKIQAAEAEVIQVQQDLQQRLGQVEGQINSAFDEVPLFYFRGPDVRLA